MQLVCCISRPVKFGGIEEHTMLIVCPDGTIAFIERTGQSTVEVVDEARQVLAGFSKN